jgi:hypothetical protein
MGGGKSGAYSEGRRDEADKAERKSDADNVEGRIKDLETDKAMSFAEYIDSRKDAVAQAAKVKGEVTATAQGGVTYNTVSTSNTGSASTTGGMGGGKSGTYSDWSGVSDPPTGSNSVGKSTTRAPTVTVLCNKSLLEDTVKELRVHITAAECTFVGVPWELGTKIAEPPASLQKNTQVIACVISGTASNVNMDQLHKSLGTLYDRGMN